MNAANVMQKAKLAISKYGMLSGAAAAVAGFSGGADSVTMLSIMDEICRERGIKLYAVHVNHGIRGGEADRDEDFCRRFCEEKNIVFFCERTDVPALAAKLGKGLEEAARDERYAILEKYADSLGADRIMTAHNADDNLETVIFNLTRGSAAKGLCGIPPVRGKIIRPLILCGKDEIVRFCETNGLNYVTDSTNSDTEYTRNFIRHEIIPKIKKLNPSAAYAVTSMCEKLSDDCGYLDGLAAGTETSKIDELKKLPYPLLSRIVAARFRLVSDSQLSGKNIDDTVALVKKGVKWSRISLPGDIVAEISGDELDIKPKEKTASPPEYTQPLKRGVNELPRGGKIIMLHGGDTSEYTENIYNLSTDICINPDAVCGSLFVRSRLPGDKIISRGMTRKLKVLYNEKHIPPAVRDVLPVVCDGEGAVWIPHCAVRDGIAESKKDGNKMTLLYISEEK